MDQQAKVAYIIAQATCAQAEIAAMRADNMVAALNGRQKWTYQDFMDLIARYGIHHNAVIEYLRD